MCGPRHLFLIQCGIEMPKGQTPWQTCIYFKFTYVNCKLTYLYLEIVHILFLTCSFSLILFEVYSCTCVCIYISFHYYIEFHSALLYHNFQLCNWWLLKFLSCFFTITNNVGMNFQINLFPYQIFFMVYTYEWNVLGYLHTFKFAEHCQVAVQSDCPIYFTTQFKDFQVLYTIFKTQYWQT